MDPAFRADYRAHLLEEDELAPSTVRQYCQRINLLEAIRGKPIEEIAVDPEEARAIKRMTQFSTSYRKGFVVCLHSVHRIGAAQGRWKKNGMMEVRPPREENDSPLPLPEEIARFLLHACRCPREFRLVHLMTLAGLRIGEAAAIRDEHWQHGRLWFRGEKNRKLRMVPVHPRLEAVRSEILACSPGDTSGLYKAKRKLQERTLITFKSHQLRKTFSTAIYNRGTPAEVVDALIGHKPTTGRLYAAVTDWMREEAVALLPF